MRKLTLILILSAATTATAADTGAGWLSGMSGKNSPALLCSAARYYFFAKDSDDLKRGACKLWIKRGLEQSTTVDESTFCNAVNKEIEEKEKSNVKKTI